jgi:hypothetical protein
MSVKKIIFTICIILSTLILVPPFPAGAGNEQGKITVSIDGLPVTFDVEPVIQNGRTMVPFRAVVEALNARVEWEGTTQTITAAKEDTLIRLQIGSESAYRNGNAMPLDAPPVILNGRTLIPLRFFAEAFGCNVGWNSSTHTVDIISPTTGMEVIGFYALGDANTSSWTGLFGKSYPQTGKGNTDTVSELALGWYSLDEAGNLLTCSQTGWQRPDGWEAVLEAAGKYDLDTEMVIHLTDKGGFTSKLLTDQSAVDNAVREITEEAKLYGGVNLDFEGLGWNAGAEELRNIRDSFSGFVALLAEGLKEENLNLTLTLHAPNSAYRGYDYEALGKLADRIIIMAYDYGPKPEPVNMVIEAVETAVNTVPPEKLILGISAPSETADSIIAKTGIAKRYNLKGVALWRLGLVSGEMWNTLRKHVTVK